MLNSHNAMILNQEVEMTSHDPQQTARWKINFSLCWVIVTVDAQIAAI